MENKTQQNSMTISASSGEQPTPTPTTDSTSRPQSTITPSTANTGTTTTSTATAASTKVFLLDAIPSMKDQSMAAGIMDKSPSPASNAAGSSDKIASASVAAASNPTAAITTADSAELLDSVAPLPSSSNNPPAAATTSTGFLGQLGERFSSAAAAATPSPGGIVKSMSSLKVSTSRQSSLNSMGQNNSQAGTPSAVDDTVYSLSSDDYALGKVIGFGSSAVVYVANYKPANKTVSIKSIDLDQFERNQIEELRKELQVMNLCKHPNLLNVKGSFVVGSKLFIVTPYLSAGSCLDIMKTGFPDGLDEQSIAIILKQALQGLDYLHKNGLIHRDVKAGNLLMDEDGTVKLADFGVSSSLYDTDRNGVRKTFVGTPCWIAPEVVQQVGHNAKADIWSFGITALELAHGRAPFAKYPPMKVLLMTLQNDPPTLDRNSSKRKFTKTFKEMIDTCLQKDPAKRPSSEKLLQHPFFKHTKKKTYLVDSIVKKIPPVTERPHKEPKTKEETIILEDGWDFSTIPAPSLGQDELLSSESSPHSSEEALAMSGEGDKIRPHTTPANPEMRSQMGLDSGSLQPSAASSAASMPTPLTNIQQQKKGRFVVDTAYSSQGETPVNQQHLNFASGHNSTGHSRASSVGNSAGVHFGSNVDGSGQEIRKGRFQVIGEASAASAQSSIPEEKEDDRNKRFGVRNYVSDGQGTSQPAHFIHHVRKMPSVDSALSHSSSPSANIQSPAISQPASEFLKKGRFEVTSSSNITSPASDASTVVEDHLNSSQQQATLTASNAPPSTSNNQTNPVTELARSIGASFIPPSSSMNLSEISSNLPSRHTSLNHLNASASMNFSGYTIADQVASILAHHDAQRNLIADFLGQIKGSNIIGNGESGASTTTSRHQNSIADSAMMSVTQLSNLIASLSQENQELRRENSELREMLRRHELLSSSSAEDMSSATITKVPSK